MKILGLDTSTLTAGVALWDGARVVSERQRVVTKHSDALLALVDEVLREAGVAVAAVDGVACGAGPGSFTGLRIALATAKGLCFALDRPLVLVSSLAALAARAPDGPVCAVLDAHKAEVYAGYFFVSAGVVAADGDGAERALPPAQLAAELTARAPLQLIGEGVLRYPELLVAGAQLIDDGPPRGAEVARLGAARLAAGAADDLASAAPRYIRPSEAELVKLKTR